jgi:hypothetical protein
VVTALPDPRLTPYGLYAQTVLKNPYIFHKPAIVR